MSPKSPRSTEGAVDADRLAFGAGVPRLDHMEIVETNGPLFRLDRRCWGRWG
jgi:hypothetical protein